MRTIILTTGLLVSALLLACTVTAEIPPGMARATFAVHCYDVGAGALNGRPGVVSVERGWSGFYEVDRVIYDPRDVSLSRLESWLREAGTYIKTLENEVSAQADKEKTQ